MFSSESLLRMANAGASIDVSEGGYTTESVLKIAAAVGSKGQTLTISNAHSSDSVMRIIAACQGGTVVVRSRKS